MHSRFNDDAARRARRGGAYRMAPFGPWGYGPPPFRRGRGHGGPGGRARRGDVRAAILALLSERPMHGYEIIQELETRTDGLWRPSPGSVYPTLSLLEDEGLVASVAEGGKRNFSLTDEGRTQAAARTSEKSPWDEVTEGVDPAAGQMRENAMALAHAVTQVMTAGSDRQREEAAAILAEARRRIYGLLAEEQ